MRLQYLSVLLVDPQIKENMDQPADIQLVEPTKNLRKNNKLVQKQAKFQRCIVEHPFLLTSPLLNKKIMHIHWPTICELLTPTIANHHCS